MTVTEAAMRWSGAQAQAKTIIEGLQMRDGELISPWANETQLVIGESVVAEIRCLLPQGWTAETEYEGLILRAR